MSEAEIGEGYIKISADASGLDADLNKKVGNAAESGGTSGGNRFSKGFGKVLKTGVLGAAAGVATAVGGVIGVATAKGFSRVQAIEQAQAKLSGLGHSAESVKTIMNDALVSVKGTAFGLGEAAGVAASAVASGVKPGQELQRTLKLMGDAATIAGTDMGEMGLIFNKVAATGKVQGEVIQQLGERGIPILQLLGKQLGKTPEEVAKLASQGKIGFKEFQDAMEEGLGGAALKSGETFKGAMANTMAALGRLGAVFVAPAFEGIKKILNSVIPVIDLLTDAAKPLGEVFGNWVSKGADKAAASLTGLVTFATDFVTGWNTAPEQAYRMGDALSDTAQKAVDFRSKFEKIKTAISDAMSAAQNAVATGAGKINALLGGTALGGITGLKSTIEQGFSDAFSTVSTVVGDALTEVSNFIDGFLKGFGGLDALGQAFLDIIPIVTGPLGIIKTAIVETFNSSMFDGINIDASGLGEAIGGALRPVADSVAEFSQIIVGGLSDAIADVLPAVLDFGKVVGPALGDLFARVAPIISDLASKALPAFATIWSTITGTVSYAMGAILPLISNLVDRLAPVMGDIAEKIGPKLAEFFEKLQGLWEALAPVLQVIVDVIVGLLAPAFETLGGVVEAVFTFIGDLISSTLDVIMGVVDVFTGILTGNWELAWQGLQDIVGGFADQIEAILTGALDVILALLGGYWSQISGAATEAWTAIADFFVSLWEGISANASESWNSFLEMLSGIWTTITTNASDSWNSLVEMLSGLWTTITTNAQTSWDSLVALISGAWASISGTASAVWSAIVGFLSGIWSSAVGTAQGIWSGLIGFFSGLWSSISGTATSIWNSIVSFITGIPGRVMAGLQSLSQLGAKAAQWFLGFLNAAKEKFNEAVNFAKGIPGKIVGALSGVGGQLVSSGRSMIEGFTRGIREGFNNAVAAARDGLARVREFFPFSPAKKGPFSGKGYTTFSGQKLMSDFGVGITKGQKKAVAAAEKASAAISKGLKGTALTSAKGTLKIAEDFDKASAKLVTQITTLQKDMTNLMRKDFGTATVLGTSKTASSMFDKVTGMLLKVQTPVTQKLANYIAAERVKLDKLLKSRETIATKIKDANKRLDTLVKDKANYVEKLYEKTYDTSALFREGATAKGMIRQLTAQVSATKKFRADLDRLSKMGLSKNLVEEIAQAGVESGGATAAALIKGGSSAIKQVNGLSSQLSSESSRLAKSMGAQMYDAGINATKGLVAGLTKQQNEVAKAAGQLANTIAKTIKSTLKINSPSKVITDLAEWAGKGVPVGLFKSVKDTLKASKALANAAVPDIPQSQYAMAGGPDGAVEFRDGANIFYVTIPMPEEVVRDASLFFKWLSGLPSNVFQQKGRSVPWRK